MGARARAVAEKEAQAAERGSAERASGSGAWAHPGIRNDIDWNKLGITDGARAKELSDSFVGGVYKPPEWAYTGQNINQYWKGDAGGGSGSSAPTSAPPGFPQIGAPTAPGNSQASYGWTGSPQGAPGGGAPGVGGGGSTGGAPGGGGARSTFVNTAQEDPRLAAHAKRIEARLDDPMGSTGRAIDVAGSKIRDAFEGRRSALKGMMAGRGMLSSSSAPEIQAGRLANDEGRAVAGAAADIALARERDNDAFMLGSTGALAAPGEAMARDRAFNLNQFLGLEGNRRADESLDLDRWNMGESNRRADQQLALSAWEAAENQRRMQEAAQINNFMSQLSLIDRLSMF